MQDKETAKWIPGDAPVAVVMISLNEAHNLREVLENLRGWAQEVFLVDSYSSDETTSIALEYGVHVIQRAFQGFGDQWNFALSELPITAPWTMKLDPDERLSPKLKDSIREAIAQSGTNGLTLKRRLFFMTRALPIRQEILRVWRTGTCRFSDVAVNEHPIVQGAIQNVGGELEHHDSPHLHHWCAKQNNYSTAEALAAYQGAELSSTPSLFGSKLQRRMWLKKNFQYIPFRFSLLFLWNYFVLGTYRAGWPGFAWARLRSDVYRMQHYKLKEMQLAGRALRPNAARPGPQDERVSQR